MAIYKDKKRGTWYFRIYVEDKYGMKKQIFIPFFNNFITLYYSIKSYFFLILREN